MPKSPHAPTNFDFRIDRETAIFLIEHDCLKPHATIMCAEIGDDDDWQEVNAECLIDGDLPEDYETFEIWAE